MTLTRIADTILDETSTARQLHQALDDFTAICSDITGILPDASFNAWTEDSLLQDGVAINPQAAAHCVTDYLRSVIFLRGAHAAINTAASRFPNTALQILYAGCGPYATLLLPLLTRFDPGELDICLLDIHPQSMRAVRQLIAHFELGDHHISTVEGDACNYQHPTSVHLILSETMQKALEQEPQFAITANLAPQLHPGGIFIPEKIEVELCLAQLDKEQQMFARCRRVDRRLLEKNGKRHPLGTVLTLLPAQAATQLRAAQQDALAELNAMQICIPHAAHRAAFDALFFTRIVVFAHYHLHDYETQITLPLRCQELAHARAGDTYRVGYRLGSYPKFNLTRLSSA